MQEFDGISIMPPMFWNSPDKVFSSDACLDSCGRWSNGEAFHAKFPIWLKNMSNVHINELKLIMFVVSLKLWENNIRNKNVLAYCDNEVSVEVVNSGKARNKFTQSCLREICFLAARANAQIKLVHLEGSTNRISDCLSRFDDTVKHKQFYQLTQGVNVKFRHIEEELFKFSHKW